MPDRLPTDRPCTAQEALALGLSRRELDAAVARNLVARLSRGRYERIDGVYQTRAHVRARIAELMEASQTVFIAAHGTAALIHGLRTPDKPSSKRLTVMCGPLERRPDYKPDVVILPAKYDASDVTVVDGIAVTTLERTAIDLARGLSLARAFVSLDHALCLGATRSSLMEVRDRMSGWPGTRILNQAIHAADGRSESALESASRGVLLAAGLPAPYLQAWVEGASGAHYRADFSWPAHRVIGESDGMGKQAKRGEYNKQIFRDSDLREAGWTVIHWTFEQIMAGRQPALGWVATALNARLVPLHSSSSRKTRRVA